MINQKFIVNLKNHSYPIHIGSKIFQSNDILSPASKGDRILVVTDTIISPIWKKIVLDFFLTNDMVVNEFILLSGEQYKNLHSVEMLLSFLLKNAYDRNTILVALGGGVIGDLVGFVASIYQRGIRFIQIPTTLLSQVDASIGGKTGVNHIDGKNMIGSFWQPISVITNVDFLFTLPYAQLVSGLAEIIKYAISFDYGFFEWLEKNIYQVLSLDLKSILYCINKCCILKSKIVTLDERENNCRMFLNFGHTFGHAIESYFEYLHWLHGESISVGMVIAIKISEKIGLLDSCQSNRMINLIQYSGLPISPPYDMSPQSYFPYILRDKKNSGGKIRIILPTSIGSVKIFDDFDRNVILSVIKSCWKK
ncbi:3-dehydroquinate synthase [Buchnera aphidicola (Pterocallis alni)]|uniref:3-dehydroquinate synthase n=1 Tax=Buchnera aphidicola TaxID=9 RepID=UPI0034641176